MTSPPPETNAILCLSCGYDLRGISIGTPCPECGTNNAGHAEVLRRHRSDASSAATTNPVMVAVVLSILIVTGLAFGSDFSGLAIPALVIGGSIIVPTVAVLALIGFMASPDQAKLERDAWLASSLWFIAPWLALIPMYAVFYLGLNLLVPVTLAIATAWLVSYLRLRKRLMIDSTASLVATMSCLGFMCCLAPSIVIYGENWFQ